MKDEIIGDWESVFYTLKELDPKVQCVPDGKEIKFKASTVITLKFMDNDEARTFYEFDNIKPI